MTDDINPQHYKQGILETIETIELMGPAFAVSYCIGNAIKYVSRAPYKLLGRAGSPNYSDLEKARWYCARARSLVSEYNVDMKKVASGIPRHTASKLAANLEHPQLQLALVNLYSLNIDAAYGNLHDLLQDLDA